MNVFYHIGFGFIFAHLLIAYNRTEECQHRRNRTIYVCNHVNSETFPYNLTSAVRTVMFDNGIDLPSLEGIFAADSWMSVQKLSVYGSMQKELHRYDFRGLTDLKSLHWINGMLNSISFLNFTFTPHLEVLDMSGNRHLSFSSLIKALQIYTPQNLRILRLRKIHDNGNLNERELPLSLYQTLKSTKLEILDISGTGIVFINSGIHKYLHFLKTIDMSDTTLLGTKEALYDIIRINTMETIIMSGVVFGFGRNSAPQTFNVHPYDLTDQQYTELATSFNVKNIRANGMLSSEYIDIVGNASLCIDSIRCLHFSIEQIWLDDNRIRHIDLSFIGLDNVKLIGLSNNRIEYIAPKLLRSLLALEHIDLSSNRLWKMSQTIEFSYLFRDNIYLQCINFTSNNLEEIPRNLFENNIKLKKIILRNNNFGQVDLSLPNTQSLEILDLSNNSIYYISDTLRKDLELINQNQYMMNVANDTEVIRLKVDLSGNKFVCSCKFYDFIHWVLTTNVTLEYRNNYTCVYDDKLVYITHDIVNAILGQCDEPISPTTTIAIVIPVILLVLLVAMLSGVFVYRRRRLSQQTSQIQELQKRIQSSKNKNERFLVFLAYSHKNEDFAQTFHLELQRRLLDTLNIADPLDIVCNNVKDFRPGSFIDEEVVRCIENSDVTILLISSASVKSRWSQFETVVAHNLGKPIFLIFLEHIEISQLPQAVRRQFKKKVRLVWPSKGDKHITELFWNTLCKEIIRCSKENMLVINKDESSM